MPDQVEILICSANLGNAQPDDDSWNHWIPENGALRPVLESKSRYPPLAADQTPWPASWELDDYDEHDHFDIIVFGMQESTFEEPTSNHSGSVTNLTNHGVASLDGLPSPTTTSTSDTINHDSSLSATARRGVNRGVKKTISAIHSLSANRDYTAKDEDRQLWHGGTHVLHQMLERRLPSYDRVVSFQRGEMRLVVLTHKFLKTQVLHVDAQNTGRGGFANKGGIVAELLVHETTRISFVTTHLEAHEGKYATRCSTMADIFGGTKRTMLDCGMSSHYSFVMGDLNFRTEHPDHEAMGEDRHKKLVRLMVDNENWRALNEIDELHKALAQKDCLVGYSTLFCNFPPTFKVERKHGYDYIDKRRPSYTDRILWKANHQLGPNVEPMVYEPIDNFTSSDHKPIRAAFSIKLNDSYRLRPRLVKSRSSIRLFQRQRRKPEERISGKEKFHLFVSEISCAIKDSKPNWSPNPYICFISDPPEALQQTKRNGARRLVSFVRRKLLPKKLRRRRKNRTTAGGFPRSSIHKSQFTVDFTEEEIHASLKTHDENGIPIDLTGAMVHLVLMDHRPSADDAVIGSFTVNLVNLIQSARPSSSRRPQNRRKMDRSHNSVRQSLRGLGMRRRESSMMSSSDNSHLVTPPRRPFGQARQSSGITDSSLADTSSNRRDTSSRRRSSVLDFFRRGESLERSHDEDDEEDEDPIETLNIDSAVLKNGVETGRIKCKIDAWWIDESNKVLDLFSSGPSRSQDGSVASADSSNPMLQKRRVPRSRRAIGSTSAKNSSKSMFSFGTRGSNDREESVQRGVPQLDKGES